MTTGNGHHIYRASSLGGCSKAIIAARLDYDPMDPPESMGQVFAEGNLHETAVIDWLKGRAFRVQDVQLETVIHCPLNCLIIGHIDGVVEWSVRSGATCRAVLEVKSMSDAAFKEFSTKRWATSGLIQKYKWQLSAYMVALGLPGMVVVKNRNNGQHLIVEVPEPFYDSSQLVARVVSLEIQARKGLPESCDNPSYPCPFYYLHEEKAPELVGSAGLASQGQPASPELGLLVAEYQAAKDGLDVAKDRYEINRRKLAETMSGKGTTLVNGCRVQGYMKGGREQVRVTRVDPTE